MLVPVSQPMRFFRGLTWCLLLSLVALATHAQSILTVAGGGTIDGQLISNVAISDPAGVAFDHSGNFYFASRTSNQVLKMDAKTRVVTVVAGNGASGSSGDGGLGKNATFAQLGQVALDANDNVYIADIGNGSDRIRRVDAKTGIITPFAGGGTPADGIGDGGQATAAQFALPFGLTIDRGFLYVTDYYQNRVRRIEISSGVIETFAGSGSPGDAGDGIQATDAYMDPRVVAFDKDGNLLISDDATTSIRRVDKTSHMITTAVPPYFGFINGLGTGPDGTLYIDWEGIETVAPGSTERVGLTGFLGAYDGDGLAARAAILTVPWGIALDGAGNLFIADAGHNSVRKVSAADGTISTIAGQVGRYDPDGQDNIDASQAVVGIPKDVAFDPGENLFIADIVNNAIWRIDKKTNLLTRYAGGGSPPDGFGDDGPALSANIEPWGIAFDSEGNLYIAERFHARVRKIDASTKTIKTIAGTTPGYSGDGGQATSAQLQEPISVAVDNDGNILISEYGNQTLRKIDRSGVITTIAGSPMLDSNFPIGDEGPAKNARIWPLYITVDRKTGDILFTDFGSERLRRIDAQDNIHTVAGSSTYYSEGGFSGDNGPAKDAKLGFGYYDVAGIATSLAGDIYFSDTGNNRVRAVFACVTVAAPQLIDPPTATISPKLSWNAVKGAFGYDVKVDTSNPPQRLIASDLTETTFTPSLAPGTKYFWSVTAKGDKFCPSVSTAASAVSTFTTPSGCGVASFDLVTPADGATSATQLTWQAAAGARTYDLYLGSTSPPPLLESGLTSTTHAVPNVPGQIFWFVVAHASCDGTKTATTPIRSYTASSGSLCGISPSVTALSPPNGAANVSTTASLAWSISQISAPVDVYFGTTSDPPLLQRGIPATQTTLALPALDPGATYYWRVVGGCSSPVTSQTFSFTTQTACNTPQSVQILFRPATVSAGATYTIVWSLAAGLDVDGGYLVERSTSASFAPILDSQITSSAAASFVAGSPGTLYHRVRAIPACDPTKSGPLSDVVSVAISNAQPNIIFTVQPAAVVMSLGDRFEDHPSKFTLENIGATPAQVIVSQSVLPGSPPFFSIAEGAVFITLQPRKPRTFTIQYSGPPNNTAASYQGVIVVNAVGSSSQLAVTPYAFVNLKVGGSPAVAPQFVIDGSPGEYVAFPGFAGDNDSNRAGRDVTIRNSGSSPMDLAAEIGPEVWLVPEDGWNSQALPAGMSRTFKLFTRRPFAPSGSPLPRYTYFTVRTKDGASSRLLVQDNDLLSVSSGRSTALDVSLRSFIVPDAAQRLRLTNNGGDSVQVELIFTPSGADGFDITVKRAVIVVPPNDVVTLVNPILQVFGAAGTTGQIEVRIPRERLGLISVTASVPVVSRGDGARVAAPHVLYIPTAAATITLAETSGLDKATVRLVSDNGQTITQDVPRYGTRRINVNAASRWDVNVDSGGGSVIALGTIGTFYAVSRPSADRIGATSLARAFWKTNPDANAPNVTTVVPVISGSTSAGNQPSFRTAIGLVVQSSGAQFLATFYPSGGGAAIARPIPVAAGVTTVINDVMKDVFAVSSPSDGNLFLQGPPNSKVYAVLQQTTGSGSTPVSSLPIPTTLSEALTSATSSSQRPLAFDGLEQSVDPTRGTRWMLLLNEVGGAAGLVNVRLYEAGNRTSPIADQDMQVSANQQLKLDTVFAALGLDAEDRRKDRTNVEVVVTATGGSARVAASAVSIDNQSGETKVYALTPVVGSGNPNITFATPVVTSQPPVNSRHHVVRH